MSGRRGKNDNDQTLQRSVQEESDSGDKQPYIVLILGNIGRGVPTLYLRKY
ncbi:hypothetical protein LEP1GSC103_3964 [Leptospira borgpetersenii serovar Javanica str. UI 09931]|uniref:Uncharacterized protein n=5 Tax=Leptospira borgpetersenii TaxID=174 RepID=M3HUU5_LEPBO|nr:hypothetical protein LBBP_00622 [Leptospira borgpetersenii serovar Ballum]EKQ91176.1 hypothetical protein LEP1GSC101_1520 [Leptospira borgpetersenii str. UI 09149]EKR02238.1 hypothetical protein LEP1GSC121_0910 [Leptospira borgpetersenii serovar Castellonis str. 200801910]EMG01355.1 hypothetical protein LEP1GSC123_3838 [Leptospira borgpetersenii str. 200701203]EMK11536.1 hypothetical protein LEP1GSC066_1736 [Leptospira sp. serovar Kenya str. Sh9]EMN18214.1 hypothetical protein LEP1GSC056_16